MSTFGQRLKELRTSKALTQKQLAEYFSITLRQYSRYETDVSTPSYKQLIALADYFDVSIDYLVGRSDDPKRR